MQCSARLMMVRTIVLLLAAAAGCSKPSPSSTHTTSAALPTVAERVSFLQQYVTFRRNYEQLDFAIDYTNNRGGVPGPSDWDIRLAAVVLAAEIGTWVAGMTPLKEPDAGWLKAIPTNLDLSTVSEWYGKGQSVVGINRAKRIVIYRSWN